MMDLTSDRHCRQKSLPEGDCPSMVSLLALLESVPALLWETDPDLRLTSITGAAMRTAGILAGQYTGRSIDNLFSATGDSPAARRAHELALGGQDSSFAADLNGRELQGNVKPLRGVDGGVIGVIGIALDMTERMVTARALRLSEHSYRSLIEEAPYAICRATVGGELLNVNRAMAEMLGYDAGSTPELLLRDLPLIFSPAGSFEAFQKTLLERGSHPAADGTWIRRDGQSIQVRVSGLVVRGPAGEISHLDIFGEDITEKKQLEVELSQVQRMQAVGQLAGGVAHDFNNLLTVINGHVEMLLSESHDPVSQERAGEVKQAVEKAAVLTKQLLAFSRRQVLRSRTVNLNDVIRKLMGMLIRVIKENIELTFVPGDDLGSVNADPNEIERVLLNLAVNAQDAMPMGGRLLIETANIRVEEQTGLHPDELPAGDYVEVVVRDTGVGMDRETQAHAFEPFFTTKQPNEGTGLGLSVVYGVIRQSGGCIRLQSEPGAGTTFRIYLPRVTAAPAPAHEPASLAERPRGSETILLAEDDASVRKLVADTLESLGYRVLSAPDGQVAVSMARSYPGEIHVLLSDFVMPMVGGRELATELKSMTPDLKVVFMSGYAGHTVTEKDLELAGVSFLQKPFSMDLLASTVRTVLDGGLP
jgi:PAS domain S-box-containing protein